MITFRQLQFSLILLQVFFLPFSGFDGFSFMGEMRREISIYIFLVGLFVFLLEIILVKKFRYPRSKEFYFILAVSILIALFSFVSINEIILLRFKGVNGLFKFGFQTAIFLLFSVLSYIYYYHYLRNFSMRKISQYINLAVIASFIPVCIYGIMEILYLQFNFDFIREVLLSIDILIFKEGSGQSWNLNRVSSVAFEPPFLSMYFIFSLPWLLYNYQLKKSFISGLFILLALILIYFSGSRTGLFINSIQLVLFFVFVNKRLKREENFRSLVKKYFKPLMIKLSGLLIAIYLILKVSGTILIQSDEVTQNISSLSRWGTQYASIQIALENPIFGVGYGIQGFYLRKYYPDWALLSYEIQNWSDTNYPTWPSGFSLFTRLLAETGFLLTLFIYGGLILWVRTLLKYLVKEKQVSDFYFLLTNWTIVIGFLINTLQFDSIRLLGFWISISIISLYRIKNRCQTDQLS